MSNEKGNYEFVSRKLDATKINDRALMVAFAEMQWLKTDQCKEVSRIVHEMSEKNRKERNINTPAHIDSGLVPMSEW